MEIFPAIDLMNGEAVRLTKGAFDSKKVYSACPEEIAARFRAEGARHLHIVDLDGARSGENVNFSAIGKIVAAAGIPDIEVGGGIRDEKRIETYLTLGVNRVILGTSAAENEKFLRYAVRRFGGKIAVGVDTLNGKVRTRGWERECDLDGFEFVKKLSDIGVETVIYTDISRDGRLQGINADMYAELARISSAKIIASGGVGSLDDVVKLRNTGVYGAIIGKAIYENIVSVSEAVKTGDEYDS